MHSIAAFFCESPICLRRVLDRQRQLGVGYNTAAKWVERMGGDGYVGPANHVGRRDIYRDKDGSPL